ncbi:hypothetical protein MANES_06G089401v8 [Manihot esculenta]|uniref:Uncharacterized protein n=1 Tax=Manihot esculenta TaxID=3983 RepID=A0ACB7HJI3_MANES|nr:hypothetical protein MANES_06G089401v8 [Manihot esculenta]
MSGDASSSGVPLEGLDDVEDYIWANEGARSLSWDRFSHVFDLVQNGNQAFRENHFEEAINCYSRANNIKPGDPVILGNRSAAYSRISQFLKQRPASASEYKPLNGLDPTMHAELALKDAEKVMDLRNNSVNSYILKASALILLEKYELARDVILSGLQVDPFSNPLRASLQNLERSVANTSRRSHKPERSDEFDCTLCLKLLYEPVTTPCGHSFCRSCLFQTMDRGNRCPLCRTVLFISPRTCAISVTLNNIIQKNFPEEYADRKSEHESLTNFGVDLIPLFVMDVVIPCQKFPLHIFEPRYRLMVRRIMEGNHRMGMVILDSATGFIVDFACEVEITECEPLPDGRFYLEVESRRRFRILQSWDQDGYRVAEVEWVQDDPPRMRAELQDITNNAAEYAQSWLRRAKEAARQDRRRLEKLLNVEAMMPTPLDPERFSFWLATLSDRKPYEKLELLRIRDTEERIKRGLVYLRAYEQGSSICTIGPLLSVMKINHHSILSNLNHIPMIEDNPKTKDLILYRFSSLPHLMGRDNHTLLLLFFFLLIATFNCVSSRNSSDLAFSPSDNYLIDCGSSQDTKLEDGRTFKSDSSTRSYLETSTEVQVSMDSVSVNVASNSSSPLSSSALPLYRSARILTSDSKYSLYISDPGWHWVRLYFYPLHHLKFNLTTAVFSVTTGDDFGLLHEFSVRDNSSVVFKEYLLNVTGETFSLIFKPNQESYAFINAIEVVSAPDVLLSDSASTLPQGGTVNGLVKYAFEVFYRLNVGGPIITPKNDTLSRTWLPDTEYNKFPQGSQNASVSTSVIKYPKNGSNSYIAPRGVYATAEQMKDSNIQLQNFNLTWEMRVDPGFSYLIRLHFCDIVSKSLNELYFNVYINELIGVSSLDLSSINNALATAYYMDFLVNASSIKNNTVMVQVGPSSVQSGQTDAILNGLEVIKISNKVRSLAGLFGAKGSQGAQTMKIVAAVGLVMGLTAMILLAMVCIRWQKRPTDWQKRNSFSSWLLPLHTSQATFLSSKSSSRRSSIFGSRKSKNSHSGYFNNQGLGRYFTFSELQKATQNFDEKAVIGVGGFGKVYIGELEDGIKTAIKRGNPSSQQGINEFQTEIQMLSKLRHRHLVSLIGFSDEQSEMILVYEYMANGPLRDHLYGSNLPPLSWKQRLEICIGAARGLHYLHTGAAQGIIHRDVKTTNILLDENFVAKVSDFGLSKAASLEQGYVSTAVKGSFGYLDPEYFRKQQLTEKSDVYSFGVVLFEVLCARPVINPTLSREQVNLAEWAMRWHRKGMIEKVIDPQIAGTINPGSLKKYVEAAEKCLAEYGVDRPGMGDVLWNLEYALQLQEASSVPDNSEDKSTNLIPLENSSRKAPEGQPAVLINDDSEVTTDSPMFSQLANFQGRDSSPENHADDDFSIFPPSNHENLIPSRFNLQSKNHPTPPQSLPSSPLPFLRPDFDPSPSPPEVTLLPNWWGFAFKILRSRIANIGSYFGSNSSGTKRSFWSFGNVALAVTVVLWWLYVRVRRQRRRSESVENLMQIISEKDEKIMQLLNQISQMNQVLLSQHKVLASKLAN